MTRYGGLKFVLYWKNSVDGTLSTSRTFGPFNFSFLMTLSTGFLTLGSVGKILFFFAMAVRTFLCAFLPFAIPAQLRLAEAHGTAR
eukprot:CAMPEP_0176073462 /NCGR_PEP_ID=MMETSP0120_2-20121206/36706_1 /TAXON_ID=160619 /ORGANISM="Kryptoperidinium foliaceum, Strain CCMP 1326" /LENGTH=85 /DNA_ID=CAMNT_0017407145 /DNA_START=459 /DNA_END=716 /DNA_ORIENTATION=+